MLKACAGADTKEPANIIDDHFFSIMTTLFIEGMAIDHHSDQNAIGRNGLGPQRETDQKAMHFPLPCTRQTEALASKEYGARKAEPRIPKRRSRSGNANASVRHFMLGLSDAFNNLLMGIWGNLSLINLTIERSNPISRHVLEMEQLIQNGSALINGIFSYLGERRVAAKNIRLNQLIQEINESIPIDSIRIKRDIIRASLISPCGQNSATIVAASLARLLMQFIERIQHHHRLILKEKVLTKGLGHRLLTVERLLNRAGEIITLLQRYSGMVEYNAEKLSIRALLKKLTRQYEANCPHLTISLDAARKLPLIHADRFMLQFVLQQLMDNAANAMPDQGELRIDVRTLNSESPQNRCVAYRWVDSIVVTVSDTGHGMALDTLLHVFDPFFTGCQNSGRLGMGLAASWGIVKTHGGYIHVRSKMGCGSTFKIFLPIV